MTAGGGSWSSCEGGETSNHDKSEWRGTGGDGSPARETTPIVAHDKTRHGLSLHDHHDRIRALLAAPSHDLSDSCFAVARCSTALQQLSAANLLQDLKATHHTATFELEANMCGKTIRATLR